MFNLGCPRPHMFKARRGSPWLNWASPHHDAGMYFITRIGAKPTCQCRARPPSLLVDEGPSISEFSTRTVDRKLVNAWLHNEISSCKRLLNSRPSAGALRSVGVPHMGSLSRSCKGTSTGQVQRVVHWQQWKPCRQGYSLALTGCLWVPDTS